MKREFEGMIKGRVVMHPDTLAAIKKDLNKFYLVVRDVVAHFAIPQWMVMEVLLQNIAHDSSDCDNYDHDKEVEKLYRVVGLLQQIEEYSNNCYFERWICGEVCMIVQGHTILESFEDDVSIYDPFDNPFDNPDVEDGGFRVIYKEI